MKLIFTDNAWEDYTSWLKEDKKTLKRINELIKSIKSDLHSGIGKPEPLKYDLAGLWSRRINREHRLVYKVDGNEIKIYSCKYHYDK